MVGVIGGVALSGRWEPHWDAETRVEELTATHGPGARLESREAVEARARDLESARLERTKARLDAEGALTVAQAARELRRREDPPPARVRNWLLEEKAPYRSVKHALGDLAAHHHGGKLAQLRMSPGSGAHVPAWLCVGSALSELGMLPGDARRDRIMRWACTADDRRGMHTGQRLSGTDWRYVRELTALLRDRGIVAAKGCK